MFMLAISCLTKFNLPWFMDLTLDLCEMLFFTASDFTFTTRHIHNWASFLPWPTLFILSGTISLLCPSSILDTYQPGGLIFWCHIFLLFHIVSQSSRSKNTGVVCHSLLQWTTFCQNSPLCPICRGGPCTAWLIASLNYTRLWSTWSFCFLWSWFLFWRLWDCSSCFCCQPTDGWG